MAVGKQIHPFSDVIISAGSGAKDWRLQFIKTLVSTNIDNTRVYVQESIKKVVLTNLYFLEQERMTPENLQDGWGGGFDVIFYENGFFKRLDKICYLFWSVDIAEESWKFKPLSILRYSYVKEKLFIKNFITDSKQYIIAPINDRLEVESYPDRLDFSSKVVASCLYVNRGDKNVNKLYFVYFETDEKKLLMHALDVDGHLAFAFHEDLFASFQEGLKIIL